MKPRLTTPSEILTAALEKEASARDFYGELAEPCHVDFVKDLHLRLPHDPLRGQIRGPLRVPLVRCPV
jgi:rubrerythrin